MKDRVLILDPDRQVPESLGTLLRQRDLEPDYAENLGQAISKMSVNHYALVFVDSGNTDPEQLLSQLRPRVRHPSCILVIGPDRASNAVQALQAGARHYWARPLDPKEVARKLDEGSLFRASSAQRYQREGTLLQVIKEIALTMELDGLVNILMDSAMELTEADGGAMLIQDDRTGMLAMKALRGMSGDEERPEYFGLTVEKCQEILDSRSPLFLLPEDPLVATNKQKISALIAAPIWWKEEPLGLLIAVKFADGQQSFANDEFKLLSLLVDEISGAVYNAVTHYKTKELTIKDDLTDAYNRRYFERYLEEEFMRARRYSSHLSLIFFDVDNLKEVNLRYGHLIGSKTLQEVAHRMILTVRGIDKVVRYGGDEFCVVLPETDTQGALQVAERIRVIVASKPFMINENIPVTITGSIGIASFPAHAASKDELVRQADKAMFAIKNKTKNAIGIAESLVR